MAAGAGAGLGEGAGRSARSGVALRDSERRAAAEWTARDAGAARGSDSASSARARSLRLATWSLASAGSSSAAFASRASSASSSVGSAASGGSAAGFVGSSSSRLYCATAGESPAAGSSSPLKTSVPNPTPANNMTAVATKKRADTGPTHGRSNTRPSGAAGCAAEITGCDVSGFTCIAGAGGGNEAGGSGAAPCPARPAGGGGGKDGAGSGAARLGGAGKLGGAARLGGAAGAGRTDGGGRGAGGSDGAGGAAELGAADQAAATGGGASCGAGGGGRALAGPAD